MLNKLKKIFIVYELLRGNYGIERELLRVNKDGEILLNLYLIVFGDKIKNFFIIIDFFES